MKILSEIEALHENIRILRRETGLSKRKFSYLIGISEKSLSLLENNIIPERLSIDFLFR